MMIDESQKQHLAQSLLTVSAEIEKLCGPVPQLNICPVCGDPTFRIGGYCSREHEKQGKP